LEGVFFSPALGCTSTSAAKARTCEELQEAPLSLFVIRSLADQSEQATDHALINQSKPLINQSKPRALNPFFECAEPEAIQDITAALLAYSSVKNYAC
jgi:hypothetical protein